MFRRTDFGGFLVCCQIGHPYLNDVENNSVAISLMLSLENAQIDWTTGAQKKNALSPYLTEFTLGTVKSDWMMNEDFVVDDISVKWTANRSEKAHEESWK